MIHTVHEAKRLLRIIQREKYRDVVTEQWIKYLEEYILANSVAGAA